MSDNKDEIKRYAEVFAEGYNSANGTSFVWDDEKSFEPGEPFDFKLYEGKNELGVQHRRGVESEDRDFKRPKWAAQLVALLKEKFKAAGISGYDVFLILHTPVSKSDEQDKLAFYILEFVSLKIAKGKSTAIYELDDADDWLLVPIKQWVSQLTIHETPEHEGVSFGYGTWPKEPEPLLDDAQVVINAVNDKINKYRDPSIILLITSVSLPFSDFYVDEIKSRLQDMPIDEVWLADMFEPPRSFRVK